jgi:DNA-binding XRE family transcriptional regulator
MSVHTKKHPTEAIEIRFIGPITNRARAVENLKDLGFVPLTDSIHWREAFPEYGSDDSPAICLRGARIKEGLTQIELANMTNIPQRHISMMENSKRPIGKEMAKRLGKALNIDYKVFL